MAARQIRWACPSGEHPAVLGGKRPRKNATVRYCLPCSEAEGVLVERVAPAIEKERARKTEVQERKRARAKETEKQRKEREARRRRSREIIDLRDMAGNPVRIDLRAELESCSRQLGIRMPRLDITRNKDGCLRGSARPASHRVHLSVGPSSVPGKAEYARELVLHEALHLVPESSKPGEWHGPRFKRRLLDAARERWPEIRELTEEAEPLITGRSAYDLDGVIVEALQEVTLRAVKP